MIYMPGDIIRIHGDGMKLIKQRYKAVSFSSDLTGRDLTVEEVHGDPEKGVEFKVAGFAFMIPEEAVVGYGYAKVGEGEYKYVQDKFFDKAIPWMIVALCASIVLAVLFSIWLSSKLG